MILYNFWRQIWDQKWYQINCIVSYRTLCQKWRCVTDCSHCFNFATSQKQSQMLQGHSCQSPKHNLNLSYNDKGTPTFAISLANVTIRCAIVSQMSLSLHVQLSHLWNNFLNSVKQQIWSMQFLRWFLLRRNDIISDLKSGARNCIVSYAL